MTGFHCHCSPRTLSIARVMRCTNPLVQNNNNNSNNDNDNSNDSNNNDNNNENNDDNADKGVSSEALWLQHLSSSVPSEQVDRGHLFGKCWSYISCADYPVILSIL